MRRSWPSPRSFVLALLRALHLWLRLRSGAATPPRGKVHSTQAVNQSPLTGGLSTDKGHAGDQSEALGRSRGGLTTKVHLGCDGRGRPLSVVLTPGQRHDSTQLEPVLDAIRVPRPFGRGRPRKRPDHLVGDKAYSYPTCRRLLRRRGIPHTIPQRSDQRARRTGRPGRPLAFDRERYRGRNVVERCFNRLKQFRAVATRYDKRADNYRAMVVIASLLIWLEG
jgi:transposase